MAQKEVLVRVEGVSKRFCRNLKRSLWYGASDIVGGLMGIEPTKTLRKDEFWAVDNVTFEVRRGECLGLIGHNGAGKSTLLKMLNGLIRPDSGRIEMHGKIGALIELGAGFNPLLTGRENVYINGTVLGFTKDEIDQKFDIIVAFAELKEFIDMPVQNYSSGMKVRLGFAVAAQMKPDILLIDEVLAVGDLGFVLKCFNRIDELLRDTAIIFVSHGMPQVARMCTNLILLDGGITKYYSSDVASGISLYYSRFESGQSHVIRNSDFVELEEIWIERHDGHKEFVNDRLIIPYGFGANFYVKIKAYEQIFNPRVTLTFYDKEQRNFAEAHNFPQGDLCEVIEENTSIVFKANFNSIPFAQGFYSVTVGVTESKNGVRKNLLRAQSAVYFQVAGKHHGWAPIQFSPTWTTQNLLETK